MGNLLLSPTSYSTFSQLGRNQLAGTRTGPALSTENAQALADAGNATRRILASGVAGDVAQDATSALGNIEKVSRLADGDVNAVNLKAAVDLGAKLTQGEFQEALGRVAAPLSAVVSVEALGSRIEATKKDPTVQNVKSLVSTTRDATTAFSVLGKLVVENSGSVATFASRISGDLGQAVARGLGSSAAGSVKAGISGGSRVLGQIGAGLSIGVAAMDVVIAGTDIRNYWNDPSGKNLARMGFGVVAAGASVLAATRIPGLSTPAAIVAALADVSKFGVDVNWKGVYDGTKVRVGTLVSDQASSFKQDILSSRLPKGAIVNSLGQPVNPSMGLVGMAMGR